MNAIQRADQSDEFAGIRALIVGFAREGTALARFLLGRGAQVTVTDIRPAEALDARIGAISKEGIGFSLGGHPLSLLDRVDIVFVSPGVPLDIPILVEARKRALPLSSETRAFTHACPAPVVGITGSSGKTTATALVGDMLGGTRRRVWVGGNIGEPLINHLQEMEPSDVVVMELSSFQLELFAAWQGALVPKDGVLFESDGWSPHVAALLNITPNHLDRHGTMEAYSAAKANILGYQGIDDYAVVGYDDPRTRELGQTPGWVQQVVWFGLDRRPLDGAFLSGDSLIQRWQGDEQTVCRKGDLKLLGEHNLANTLAAIAIATAAGAPLDAVKSTATTFRGVEHRLELVRERKGVRWYNDSIATAPERTMAAMRAFEAPVVLLAGGRDKHLPWDGLAALAWKKARHLILLGEAAELIESAMLESPVADADTCRLHRVDSMAAAVELAATLSRPGDVVLLSPGGTSFDMYTDYAERGDHFRQLVKALD
ncbi:UDP-N-acetylmuramoyl-L-alanine--D-glutamate ligase [Chloroflexota bacterium]